MSAQLSEADLEVAALDTLGELAWHYREGKSVAPGSGERESWAELLLRPRLRDAVARLNPELPAARVDEVVSVVATPASRDALQENYRVHEFLTGGVRKVSYTDEFGAEHTPTVRLLSDDPAENDWLAVNQVTVSEGEHKRRFDIVLYVNGMPLAIVELKNAADPNADIAAAHAQLMTYVEELPLAFRFAMVCVVSDGAVARYGSPFTALEHFSPWHVGDTGQPIEQSAAAEVDTPLNLMLHGLFTQPRTLDLLRNYVAFATDEGKLVKRIAKPHQYFAVSKAVGKTVDAVRGHGLAGVVWHTQGSGKSMEMELYVNQVLAHPALGNPTIVVLTDRTDLDDQLYGTFQASKILPEGPQQADSRDELRTELGNRTSGGIIFTTLQKFGKTQYERESGTKHPLLSDRRNIIVMADEAHRSHYDNLDGFARHLRDALPNATLIAFTGTPIADADKNTRGVFGEHIDVYDLTRAVEDGATVPVYYEPRIIKVDLPENIDPETIDEWADSATAGLDDSERTRVQKAVAAMNSVYGAPDRVRTLAEDVVTHWETRRDRLREFIGGPGKAMIVCATREICADLYDAITDLRPDWHSDDIDSGRIKVVYTGDPSDAAPIRKHVRRPAQNKAIQARMKDVDDELEITIVQSMWLTGFDAQPLHTLYLDRPMKGAALMQALARVNRTFRGKQHGLLVSYAPITDNLYKALAEYTARDQQTQPIGRDLDAAVDKVRELHTEIAGDILAGYGWRGKLATGGKQAFLQAAQGAVNHLRDPKTPGNQPDEGEDALDERFRKTSGKLARFYAICANTGAVDAFRDDIAFFEAVRVWMAKWDAEERRARGEPLPADVERTLRELTETSIEADDVTDLYGAAGMAQPDLSNLDDAFIAKMQESRNPHLAIEQLRNMLQQKMRTATRHNVVRQQSFADRLMELMRQYTNQNLSTAEVMAEIANMSREIAEDANRGERFDPPLSEAELAFYDAVADNESAVREMSTGKLADIARDLVSSLRRDVTTDWVSRDDVRAKLRSTIKRLLAKHDYPPDAEPAAIRLVLTQMETFAEDWAPEV